MSLYRARWQVEFVFTRLKSIIGVGHLPKHDPDSCLAWLYGKMVVALLVERLYQEAEFFSPGGSNACPLSMLSKNRRPLNRSEVLGENLSFGLWWFDRQLCRVCQ